MTETSFQTIRVERHEPWAEVILSRPEKLNAISRKMLIELRAALETLSDDSAILALLLRAEGRGFCAGQDLQERRMEPGAPPPDLHNSLEQLYNPVAALLAEGPKPVVCAVNGVAAGAGANLALACDLTIASREARFIEPFTAIGLIPDCGGTWILPRRIGTQRANAMILLGESIPAAQAEQWGLLWKCVEPVNLLEESRSIMARLCARSDHAIRRTRESVRLAQARSFTEAIKSEAQQNGILGREDDYRLAIAKFLNKDGNISGIKGD